MRAVPADILLIRNQSFLTMLPHARRVTACGWGHEFSFRSVGRLKWQPGYECGWLTCNFRLLFVEGRAKAEPWHLDYWSHVAHVLAN
jgi:hypothetical protein